MTVTLGGSTVRVTPARADKLLIKPAMSGPGRPRQIKGHVQPKARLVGGQYSQGSPLTAGTSLSGQPGRGTSHTHRVLVGATLPRRAGLGAGDRDARVD